jgi:Sec-independent protein translocase protein TatA
MELLVDLIGLYLLYKLVFDFIIPMATTTKEVKKQFSDMQQKMQEQAGKFEQNAQQRPTFTTPPKKPASKDDYIDFEEVK